ncbi:MAG: hypothetical protein E7559_10010, partial [Ruminococcaceae bacterium]|nr:hypothetical protein [Oscillospiraceae bacterium]
MNYIDRKAIGLEQYFAKCSSSFSSLNEFSEADITIHLQQAPLRTRIALAQMIHNSLRQLKEDFRGLDRIIPSDLFRQYASVNALVCTPDGLLPFFRWLMELQRANEQRRILCLSELSSCTARLDIDSRSFFQNFFSLNNQRVVVSPDGDSIVMTTAEREWGKVAAVFERCGLDNPDALPLLGFAFGQECILLEDGRYQINLLIDTEFGDVEYCERLLSDSGWLEFSFTCGNMHAAPICTDYVGRVNRLGTPRFE